MKRGMDLLIAGVGLIVLLPVMVVVGVTVKLTSAGPMFFRQVRVGRGGRPFRLWKFRTMIQGADRVGPGVTVGGDRRVTGVGVVFRRLKLDELPQLYNVVRGDMSLVGPRPELPDYVDLYSEADRAVLDRRPGITDPASLAYRDEEAILAAQPDPLGYYRDVLMVDKLRINREYMDRATVWSDLAVLARTVTMLFGEMLSLSATAVGRGDGSPPDAGEEEARIRDVYSARDRKGKPELYSSDRPENPFWRQRREVVARAFLDESRLGPLPALKCLDVGCGSGRWMETLRSWGAEPDSLFGIDLLEDRIEAARQLLPGAEIHLGSGFSLPFEDDSMDLVCANTVFSSILDSRARQMLADEMMRVTRPDGCLLIYDFRMSHPANPDTIGVGAREIRRLFPAGRTSSRSLTLAPPVARPLTRLSVGMARWLETVAPFLRTHAMHLLEPPPAPMAHPDENPA